MVLGLSPPFCSCLGQYLVPMRRIVSPLLACSKFTMGSVIRQVSNGGTRAASTDSPIAALLYPGVRFVIRVTLGTVRLVDVAVGAGKVLSPGNRFKMRGINAQCVLAEMVQVHPIRDVAYGQLIGQPVSQDFPGASVATDSDGELTVGLRPTVNIHLGASPQVARPQVWSDCWHRSQNRLFPQPLTQRFGPYPFFPVFQVCNHFGTSN